MRISATGAEPQGCALHRRPAERGFESLRRSAEHGFDSSRRSAEHGFTLIELMIVVTIIGLMAAVVMLAMPDPRGRLIDEAERFAARAHAARDMAIIDARPTSIRVTATGYAFDTRRAGAWTPIDAKPFLADVWSEGTAALVGRAGVDRVSFDTTGLASQPLTVTLVRSGETLAVTIGLDGEIRVGG